MFLISQPWIWARPGVFAGLAVLLAEGLVSEGKVPAVIFFAQRLLPARLVATLPLVILSVASLLHSPEGTLTSQTSNQSAAINKVTRSSQFFSQSVSCCFKPRQPHRIISGLKELISWCFETNQPQRTTSGLGLKETSKKRCIVERTNKAELKPEVQSQKAESCRENLWKTIQLKWP